MPWVPFSGMQLQLGDKLATMWQRFTERARKTIFYAQEEAQRFQTNLVSTGPVLLGLIRETDSLAVRVLSVLRVSIAELKTEVESMMVKGAESPASDMTLSHSSKKVIDHAYAEARDLINNYIGTEHLLLGLIAQKESLSGRAFAKLGVDLDAAREAVKKVQAEGN